MNCPRCGAAMQEHTFDAQLGRAVAIDVCEPCQSIWFDGRESLALTPASTLSLFRIIGEHVGRPQLSDADAAKCPRCRGRLRRTSDMQRATRFEYFKCPNEHGRLTTFFDFLKEKDFIRPLTPQQIAELRQNVQMVNCPNCGAPIDLAKTAACSHCGSPLSMLDMKQAERIVEQLRQADRSDQPIDPALPLELARARRQTEEAFRGMPSTSLTSDLWISEVASNGLVGAGLSALARWLKSR
jgi:Zn-finger nucleic acid-binding protein